MELARVRYFVAVANELNFTTAARELYMEQPALSRQIKLLEASLGMMLFERTSRHVSLTEAGEALLPYARMALDACDAGEAAARSTMGLEAGKLQIGATPQSMVAFVAPYLAEWRAEHPDVTLELVEAGAMDLIDLLCSNAVDVGIVSSPVGKELRSVPIRRSQLHAVVRASDDLAELTSLDIRDLTSRPILRLTESFASARLLESVAFARRLELDVRYSSSTAETVIALVAAGLGIGVLPDTASVRQPDLVGVPLTDGDDPLEIEIVIAWSPRRAAAYRYEAFARGLSEFEDDPRLSKRLTRTRPVAAEELSA
jgi:DNA-binding transcriptional LysR family regulator